MCQQAGPQASPVLGLPGLGSPWLAAKERGRDLQGLTLQAALPFLLLPRFQISLPSPISVKVSVTAGLCVPLPESLFCQAARRPLFPGCPNPGLAPLTSPSPSYPFLPCLVVGGPRRDTKHIKEVDYS